MVDKPTIRANRKSQSDDVRKLYESGLTVRQIAKVLDLSTQGVYWHLKRLELPTPGSVT